MGQPILVRVVMMVLVASSYVSAWGAQKKGVQFAEEAVVDGHALKLNGLGVRKAFGVVSVYVGGLYLEKSNHLPEEILASKGWKKLVLQFVMDVEKDKITEAWSEGFKKNCGGDCSKYDPEMKVLNSWMSNMRTHDELAFSFSPDAVTVSVKGVTKGTLARDDFAQKILSIFLGPQPPNKALKDGLLGLDP